MRILQRYHGDSGRDSPGDRLAAALPKPFEIREDD